MASRIGYAAAPDGVIESHWVSHNVARTLSAAAHAGVKVARGRKRERPAAGREALVEDGPGFSGAVYQDAERPGPLDQCMVRPQLPQQDR